MKSNVQLKLGAILSYVQMGTQIVLGLIYTPLMIRLLGQSEYGLYNTVSSTIAMLSILSLGFNSSYIRYYSKYKNDNDEDKISKLNGLYLIIFIFIGIIAFLCGIFLLNNLDLVFKNGLTTTEYEKAYILMFLLTVNLSVSFPMSVFTSIISANEKFVFIKLTSLITTIASPFLTLPLLLAGYGSISIVCVSVITSFVNYSFNIYYALKKIHVKFIFHDLDLKLFKSIFIFTLFIAIELIVDQINWNIDKILLARYKGTIEVAIYSVGFSLFSYYQLFSSAISGVFVPRVHKIYNETLYDMDLQRKRLTDLFTLLGRLQFLILALIATGLIFFGKPFIVSFWAGEDYLNSYYVALLLIIPSSCSLIQNIGIEIQRAQNRHQFRSVVYLIMALINLILSIFLCKLYGAIGSAIGTAISLILANGLIMNIYYHKKCNIDILEFWKNIVKISKGLILPIILGVFLINYINLFNIMNFFISILFYVFSYIVSMYYFGMNEYEKKIFIVPIKKFFKKVGLFN